MLKSILVCSFLVVTVSSVKFPNYFKPCQLSDPELNKCLVVQANAAWQGLIYGDENYNISTLLPYRVPDAAFNVTQNFYLYHTDMQLHGFETIKILSASYDKSLNKLFFKIFNADCYVTSKYNMKLHEFQGKDIYGKGKFNTSLVNTDATIEIYLTTITKEGVDYYAVEKTTFDFIPKKMFVSFSGLFNGDIEKELHANEHINKHWLVYYQNVRVKYNVILNMLVKELFNAFLSRIPKNEFLLP